jgi:MOSC domain-containing protein YiiM/GNAT superfamily N-acetyltransferase
MDGRVLQVNVSPGGVPKRPVDRAWVGPLGLEGDRHRHDTVHGGPHRAVALLGIEAIGRVQADGHPIAPGSVGENLTTEGIELATLPIGTRLAVGERLLLELSAPANPCDVIGASFRGGKSGRISIITHPTDSRMYARTLVEGAVRPGDPIRVLPPGPDSIAADFALLDRIDAATLDFTVGLWQAIAAAGFSITVEDDGELAMASSSELTSSAFNRALGHRMLPQLTDRMCAFFEAAGMPGWIVATGPPWPGAVAEGASITFAAEPSAVPEAEVEGLTIREIGASEADTWSSVLVEASGIDGADRRAWVEATRRLVGAGGRHHLIAEREGAPVGVSGLFTRRRVGLLATTAVIPAARGHGIQRALIAHRARLAAERGSTLVAASASVGSPSATNLEAMGLRGLQESAMYHCDLVAATVK